MWTYIVNATASIQAFLLSDSGLTLNSVVTFLLACLSIFYYRRFLPDVELVHFRYVWLDHRYLDVRVTIVNDSQSADKVKTVYLGLPDNTRLMPLPEAILKEIKVSETSWDLNLDEFIALHQDKEAFPLVARSGKMLELPTFLKPYETVKARFVFDGKTIMNEDLSQVKFIVRLPYRKKSVPLFKASGS